MKKRTKIFIFAAALLVVASLWMVWGNLAVTVSEYTVECEALPASFSGVRIAHISDLHNTEFGEGNARLINKLKNTRPDMIVLTGNVTQFAYCKEKFDFFNGLGYGVKFLIPERSRFATAIGAALLGFGDKGVEL